MEVNLISIRAAIAAAMLALGVLICMAGGLAPGAAQAQSWQEFRATDGKFFALMPGPARNTEQSYGNGGVGRRLLVENADDEAFLLEWTDYPASLARSKPPEQHLVEAQANALKAFANGRLLRDRTITQGQWPGRAFIIDLNDGLILQANHYWVGERLYQLIVVTGKEKSNLPAIADFFGAFQILKR